MKSNCTTCSRRSRRVGLTLIEVVAAIVILGTILVGVVLARSRHTRQIRLAGRKAAAVQLADRLLTDWWTDPNGVPVGRSGSVGENGTFVWETRELPRRDSRALGGRVVELTVRNAEVNSAFPTAEPLTRVQLVLPLPPEEGDDANAAPSNREARP